MFAIANSLRLQGAPRLDVIQDIIKPSLAEYIARALSDYLTAEAGITIIFESAIVPKWRDSRISFKNVFITRRPDNYYARQRTIDSGHPVAAGYDLSNHPSYHGRIGEEDDEGLEDHSDEDLNYSMFDLNVDSIDVTLSFARWFEGKGLVEDAVIKGVRGVLGTYSCPPSPLFLPWTYAECCPDRRNVTWDPDNPLDPAAFRHEAQPGDFELESLQIEDLLITVYQPGDFRPFTASIFRADIRTFRKQWAFYDFLRAENVVGQYDNCLFSLHRPQSIGRTTDQDLKDGKWSRVVSRSNTSIRMLSFLRPYPCCLAVSFPDGRPEHRPSAEHVYLGRAVLVAHIGQGRRGARRPLPTRPVRGARIGRAPRRARGRTGGSHPRYARAREAAAERAVGRGR